jgi:hypothetical protein
MRLSCKPRSWGVSASPRPSSAKGGHGARFYKTWLSDLPGHSHFTIEVYLVGGETDLAAFVINASNPGASRPKSRGLNTEP